MYNIYRPNRQSVQDTAVSLAERPKLTGHCGLIGWEPQTYRTLRFDWLRAPNLQDTAVWLAESPKPTGHCSLIGWDCESPKPTWHCSLIGWEPQTYRTLRFDWLSAPNRPQRCPVWFISNTRNLLCFFQEPVLGENGTKHWSCKLACSSLKSQSDDLTICQLFYMCIYTKWQWSLHLNWAASQKFCVLRAWFQELVKGMSTVQNELKKLPKVCPLLQMNSGNCQQTFDEVRMKLNIVFTTEFISPSNNQKIKFI